MSNHRLLQGGLSVVGGGGSFSPISIPDLSLWLDASDAATLFQDAALTTPAVSAADPVGGWKDKSASGANATTDSLLPALTIVSGKNAVKFSGAQKMSAALAFDPRAVSIFIVSRPRFPREYKVYVGGADARGLYWRVPSAIVGQANLYDGGVPAMPVAEWPVRVHGISSGTGSVHYFSVEKSATGTALSAGGTHTILHIGQQYNNTKRIDEDIYEIVVYSRAVTDGEAATIISGLASKHGVVQRSRLAVFDGDSLTYGVGVTSGFDNYPNQVMALYNDRSYYSYNAGESGATMAQILAHSTNVDAIYSSGLSSNIVTLLGGHNSLATGVSAAAIYADITTYVAARKLAGYSVVVCTIFPGSDITGANETARVDLNALIVANAAGADAIADTGAAAQLQNPANTTYFFTGGVHLKQPGYAVVAAIVKAAMDTLA